MRIFTEKPLKEFGLNHPEALSAIKDWIKKVKQAEWHTFADIKKTFNSID